MKWKTGRQSIIYWDQYLSPEYVTAERGIHARISDIIQKLRITFENVYIVVIAIFTKKIKNQMMNSNE